jgi:hypothetical protein
MSPGKLTIIILLFPVLALTLLIIGVFYFLYFCLAGIFTAVAVTLIALHVVEGEATDHFRLPREILTKAGERIEMIWTKWKEAASTG